MNKQQKHTRNQIDTRLGAGRRDARLGNDPEPRAGDAYMCAYKEELKRIEAQK